MYIPVSVFVFYAATVLDSTGKPGSGLFSFDTHIWGNYGECRLYSNVTKYCMISGEILVNSPYVPSFVLGVRREFLRVKFVVKYDLMIFSDTLASKLSQESYCWFISCLFLFLPIKNYKLSSRRSENTAPPSGERIHIVKKNLGLTGPQTYNSGA